MSSLDDLNTLRGRSRTSELVKNEKDKDLSTNINYTCHVCAVDVPAAFSEEHNASKQHQANASIMAAASKRMRAMVTARPPPRTPRPAGTFCGVCNTIAEDNHKKTAKHKQAVRDDQLLCLLASIYCGEDDSDDDSKDQDDKDKKKGLSDGRNDNNEAKVANKPDSVSVEEKIETKEQNEHDINSKVGEGDATKVSTGNRERATVRNKEETENAATFDGDEEVGKAEKDSNANTRNDTNVAKTGTVAYSTELTKPLGAEERNDNKQLNKDSHAGDMQRVEIRNPKNDGRHLKNAVNTIAKPDNVNASKSDGPTKSGNTTNEQASGDDDVSDPYDPEHKFFWALVSRFQTEQPSWRHKCFILPAGNEVQIIVGNEKLIVPYDNFHSFNRERKCIVCMEYFYTDFASEDDHIMSKTHMERIMRPVSDGHCYRRIDHWSHCILCNEVLVTSFEEKHKTLIYHCEKKREATIPSDLKLRTDLPTLTALGQSYLFGPSQKARQNVNVQAIPHDVASNSNAETEPQRRKITLQKQEAQQNASVQKKDNGRL